MYNNKVIGTIPYEEEVDGVIEKHVLAVEVTVDFENAEFLALVTMDGEPLAPDTPTAYADVYVKWGLQEDGGGED